MSKKHRQLEKWKHKLGITEDIKFEYIPRSQITCAYNRPYHLVGIAGNTIYHDRRLTEVDIKHELLHKKFPRYKESTIRRMTNE